MRRAIGAAFVVALVFFGGEAFGGGVNMEPGLWEITTVMEMSGMPFQPPPNKTTHCYTAEEIEKAGAVPEQQGDCSISDMQKSGNKMTWKVVCTGKGQGHGEGEMVFKDSRSYEGRMKFESQGMNMSSKYTGRRIGDCK